MKKILISLCLVFSFCSINVDAQAQAQTISVNGLKEKVTVRRDARSIPYIAAKTDADLYFVQGYITASDRLWQMDLLRRVARGETAEIFGKATLEEDKQWRRYGFSKIADDSLHYLTPELRLALESYSRGVNAYIASLDAASLPIEFHILQYKPSKWRPADAIVIGKILAEALSSTWRSDLLRASMQSLSKEKFQDLTSQVTPYDVVLFGKDSSRNATVMERASSGRNTTIMERASAVLKHTSANEQTRKSSLERIGFFAEELAASNNWVISGKRTADGKPILANDPHLQASAPGIWYLTHLSTPAMRVSGVTFPGVPGIVLGHNESIAWGATNVGPDVQDVYLETFDSAGRYKTPTGWQNPTIRQEEIKVRKNPLKPETETITLEVTETRNGVVIAKERGKKLALKWTARDPKNNEFEAFYFANRAKDWGGFKKALQSYGGAAQNFVYADVKGNIGWYAAGRIPIRRVGEGALPYDGSTNDGDWLGFIPFSELPNMYNPREGFIVTANQRIVGNSYKYPQTSREAAPPWRARRIYDRLKSNSKITVDTVRDIQHDSFNIPLFNLSKEIVTTNAASAETLAAITTWDGQMTPESNSALVVNEIRLCLANKIAAENKPATTYLIRERVLDWAVPTRSSRWLPRQFSDYPAFIKACDSETTAKLTARLGADRSKWVWGSISRSRFTHPLGAAPLIGGQFALPSVGLSGSGQSPNVASFVSMRHIAIPGNWDATRHLIPLGQSGNPHSPHYKDQFDAWRTGMTQIFPFSKTAIEKATKESIVMTPK